MGWNLQDYEPVENRIRAFYEENRKGRILTEIANHNDDFSFVMFKATVYRNGENEPAATGFAYEKASPKGVNATSHIENCETSAIGRALANLGYGAKGKRPSREEMQKVQNSETGAAPPPDSPLSAAPVSDHSSGGATEQGAAGGSSTAPPATDWLTLIEIYGASNVLKVAQNKAKEAGVEPPFTKKALNELRTELLEPVATELAHQEQVA